MKIQLPWKEQRSSSTDIASPSWPHSKGTKGMESDFSPWAIPFQQPGDTGTFVYLTYTGQDSWAKSKVEKGGEYILRDKGRNPAQWGIICYDYSTTLDINPKAMFYFSSPKLCFNSVMKSYQLSLSRFHHIHLLICLCPCLYMRQESLIMSGRDKLKLAEATEETCWLINWKLQKNYVLSHGWIHTVKHFIMIKSFLLSSPCHLSQAVLYVTVYHLGRLSSYGGNSIPYGYHESRPWITMAKGVLVFYTCLHSYSYSTAWEVIQRNS